MRAILRHASSRSDLNIDAIGRPLGDGAAFDNAVFASGANCWPAIADALAGATEDAGLKLLDVPETPSLAVMAASGAQIASGEGGLPSDQVSLAANVLPIMVLTGGLNDDHHAPGDTADKIDVDRLAQVAELLTIAVRTLAETAE
ncbi:hypothetical protein DXV76_19645 [Rhodobacteraceae bacterium CCMM004]|nr:hypothetical protein DXV76_19645 [Rhodobacteraceae bacterium CCMM004]